MAALREFYFLDGQSQGMTEAGVQLHLTAWKSVAEKYGLPAFTYAVQQAVIRLKYFPRVAHFEEFAQEYRAKFITILVIDKNCPECRGSGWARVEDSGKVNRCKCRTTVEMLKDDCDTVPHGEAGWSYVPKPGKAPKLLNPSPEPELASEKDIAELNSKIAQFAEARKL